MKSSGINTKIYRLNQIKHTSISTRGKMTSQIAIKPRSNHDQVKQHQIDRSKFNGIHVKSNSYHIKNSILAQTTTHEESKQVNVNPKVVKSRSDELSV